MTISITCSFNCISAFEKELKAIDSAILKTINGLNPVDYQVLNFIQVIGKVFAAGILAEIGNIKSFSNNDALAKYCGIVWKQNQSGKINADDNL